ncbi:MAG TPA: hypothetical protein VMN78_03750 [Longimicrobiales bacterium]|nr:hypothetical protein [Longimicrobiales bacterium]
MKRLTFALLACSITLWNPGAATGQTLERRGDGDIFLDDRIDRLIRTGRYLALHDEERTIEAGDTIRTSLIVLGGRLYLEGVVQGDLVGVDAELFLRPGSRVVGDVVNIGGGLYRSELAETGRVRDLPNMRYQVREEGDRVVIVSVMRRSPLELDGALGFHVPEYNRVDGLAPDWGFTWRFPPVGAVTAGLRGIVGYRTERGELAGGGSAFLERSAWGLEGGWIRQTRSNDRWIRSDLRNSADFLLEGDDTRDYYEADVAWGELRYRIGAPEGMRRITFGVRYEQEQAGSLREDTPWNIFAPDSMRANPPIDAGTIQGVIPFIDGEWLTTSTSTEARIELEQGSSDLAPPSDCGIGVGVPCPPADGSFTRLRVNSEFGMQALRDHTLEIELQFMLPLAGDEPLPRQRWGILGGSGTIRTVGDAAFRGDHLLYSETEYIIPIRRVRLPMNVIPDLQFLHMAGLAWSGARERDLVQNVGARLNVWALYVRWLIDPASENSELTFGVSWPFDAKEYPWQ